MATRNTPSSGSKPDKLMRDALSLELHRDHDDEGGKKIKKLRAVARALVEKAIGGDIAAIKEVNDRMDGKPAQAITGADDGPLTVVIRKYVGA